MSSAQAIARTNIALVKYWGKADLSANLPATGSLSLTLDELWTRTRVTFSRLADLDELRLDGKPASEAARLRVSKLLNRVRDLSGIDRYALVESENNFPTAAGLASSASGFAALAASASRAAGLDLPRQELADLARRGSGSAPRSLLGGFVAVTLGSEDGQTACGIEQIAPAEHWDLRMVIALCAEGPKKVGSTEGMERTRRTSPYFSGWVDSHAGDLDRARAAIAERDFEALGRVTEASCFKMHALAMSADPALIYLNPVSLAVIQAVWRLRQDGLSAFVTMDAGPHVKALCRPADASALARELEALPGVVRVLIAAPGQGLEVSP
jgi:diphosphomevalonate decarboxylase